MEKEVVLPDGSYFTMGDIPVKIDVNQNYASIDQVMDIANKLWNTVCELSGKISQSERHTVESMSERFETVYELYPEFTRTFPVPTKDIIIFNRFYPHVFKDYLILFSNTKLKTQHDFLKIQAEYSIMVAKHENKKITKKALNDLRQKLVDALFEEYKEFKEQYGEIEAKSETRAETETEVETKDYDKDTSDDKRKKIYDYLTNLKKISNK